MITLIVNQTAGSGRAAQIMNMVTQVLKERKIPHRVMHPSTPGETTAMAAEAAKDLECTAVISIGGDGTNFSVADGLCGLGKPMGLIPAGTGNDFIKTTGTPADPRQALEFILSHESRPIDFGSINDGAFLNACGTGFDVTVLEQAERFKKKMHGMLPYLLGLLRAIAVYRPVHIRCEYDGQVREQDVLICAVANGRFIGGGIPICREAVPDDGLLDLVLVQAIPRWRIPFYLPGLMLGKLLKFGITEHIRCRRVTIEGSAMSVQIDG